MSYISNHPRWLPVKGYEGLYEVSDHGQVQSLDRVVKSRGGQRTIPGRVKKIQNVGGYSHIRLTDRAGATKNHWVHRLVAGAFIGPCPSGQEVLHSDGDPGNAKLDNLRYGTRKDNMLDVWKTGKWSGVSYEARRDRWRARFLGEWLGYFGSQTEAEQAVSIKVTNKLKRRLNQL